MNRISSGIKKLSKGNLLLFILFILFTLKGFYMLDSDFGWHLKMGEYIIQKGIPKTDPFSYTMPSYPFVDHEWFSNIIIARLFSSIDIVGLSMLFSVFAIVAIVVSTRALRESASSIVAFIMGVILFSFTGIRVQVLSWVYCSLLLFVLFHYEKGKYTKYGIPFGMLVWSNTHGSFPLGILILLIFYVSEYMKTKKISKVNAVIFAFSVFVTFLPPYGWRRWWEVWMSLSDGGLRWNIQEWTPLFFLDINVASICYLALSIALFIKYFKKIDLFLKMLYLIFLLMAISSIRHIPFWLCVSSFQIGFCLPILYGEISNKKNQKIITKFLLYYVFIACGIQIIILSTTLQSDLKQSQYPEKAVEYLIKKNIKGNVLNSYGWGGFLIWKYPEKKVFIDGRMPSWRWKSPSKKESDNAFQDWRKIFSGKIKIQDVQKKYNIEVVLIPTNQKMYLCKKPLKWSYFFQSIVKSQEIDVFKDLKIIYQDNIATIYSFD